MLGILNYGIIQAAHIPLNYSPFVSLQFCLRFIPPIARRTQSCLAILDESTPLLDLKL